MSAIADLFDRPAAASDISSRTIEGGQTLFATGDQAGSVFLLRRGLLAVMRPAADQGMRMIGYVRAGECVGEMAALSARHHSSTVVALRDSIVDALPSDQFLASFSTRPAVARAVARLILKRAEGDSAARPRAQVILVAGTCGGVDAMAIATRIAAACNRIGVTTVALTAGDVAGDTGRITAAEEAHHLVLLAAGSDELDWLALCRRQVDRILLLGLGGRPPPANCGICATEPLMANQLVDLVLCHPAGSAPAGAADWLAATSAARLFHIDRAGAGIDRLARILTGRSVGLVLSGGGARAFAHIGVIRALREADVPIDLIGGTSMGAVIAACVGKGWDDREIDERMRDAFVTSSPLDDIALPIVAMTRGRKVEARLRHHFGDIDIADLATPFFCISSNLTSGAVHCHDRGPLVPAIRASISLPGVLPPVVMDGQVLVDGGVLRNLPTDTMRARHQGTVIGSDVTRSAGLEAADVDPPGSWMRWFGTGAWRRGPPIVSILMRSATVATGPDELAARNAADLYVMPDTAMVEIRDWRAYPRAVDAGYATMRDVLAGLEIPVGDLRRHRAEG